MCIKSSFLILHLLSVRSHLVYQIKNYKYANSVRCTNLYASKSNQILVRVSGRLRYPFLFPFQFSFLEQVND